MDLVRPAPFRDRIDHAPCRPCFRGNRRAEGDLRRHRPASEALKDWGKAHRFAGSTDRHAIGTLVYDALRRRNSLPPHAQATPRALALAGLRDAWGLSLDAIAAAESSMGQVRSRPRSAALSRALPADLPLHVAGDLPEWLAPSYAKAFGSRAAEEGAALRSALRSISASTR